jgi:hypothetical protein
MRCRHSGPQMIAFYILPDLPLPHKHHCCSGAPLGEHGLPLLRWIEIASGTESSRTLRWRGMDSNSKFR